MYCGKVMGGELLVSGNWVSVVTNVEGKVGKIHNIELGKQVY
jgi:hypothetical protein